MFIYFYCTVSPHLFDLGTWGLELGTCSPGLEWFVHSLFSWTRLSSEVRVPRRSIHPLGNDRGTVCTVRDLPYLLGMVP